MTLPIVERLRDEADAWDQIASLALKRDVKAGGSCREAAYTIQMLCAPLNGLLGSDLPERLFAHSLALIGDDEEEKPSALFLEIQEAAGLLAEIRNKVEAIGRSEQPPAKHVLNGDDNSQEGGVQ